MVGYIAIDQYGQVHKMVGCKKHPRKWLLNYFDRKSAQKFYIDTAKMEAKHIGWIIGGLWLTVYELHELN